MGLDDAKSGRPPTEKETLEMQRLLDEAYREGACGWSAQRAGEKSLQADYDGSPFPSDVMGDELCLAFGEVSSRYDVGAIQISPLENPGDYEDFSDLFKHLKVGQDFSEKLAEVSGRPILHNLITPVPGHPQILKDCLKWLADCNARGNRVIGLRRYAARVHDVLAGAVPDVRLQRCLATGVPRIETRAIAAAQRSCATWRTWRPDHALRSGHRAECVRWIREFNRRYGSDPFRNSAATWAANWVTLPGSAVSRLPPRRWSCLCGNRVRDRIRHGVSCCRLPGGH